MHFTTEKEGELFTLLCEKAKDCSKNTLRSWLEWGRISVQGKIIRSHHFRVQGGVEIELLSKKQMLDEEIEILYEDRDLIALIKPIHVLSVAEDDQQGSSVHERLKRRKWSRRVYPVHRLDRETSGVMLFALSLDARESIKAQFEKRLVQKEYCAVVEGKLEPQSGVWEHYLEEGVDLLVRPSMKQRGKYARTKFTMITQKTGFSLLELRPITGRKHQLRAQCHAAGYPIAGDVRYGARTDPFQRVALHAFRIAFTHPKTRKFMMFEAPVPKAFYNMFPMR